MENLNERVWQIIDGCVNSVFITYTKEGFCHARTMNKLLDKDAGAGVFWYATHSRSRKIAEIKENPKVTLFFAHPDTQDHASVFGLAEIVDDRETKHRFWQDAWYEFWKKGPDGDEFILIKVIPVTGEFFLNNEISTGKIDFNKKNI